MGSEERSDLHCLTHPLEWGEQDTGLPSNPARRAGDLSTRGDDEKHLKALSQAETSPGILSESKNIWATHQSHSL